MQSKVSTPDEYFAAVNPGQKPAMDRLRIEIRQHIPPGFEETMNYGMPAYVVPHTLYPPGYHTNPELPLPFLALAAQKNGISFYHMGIYADEKLLNWFISRYTEAGKGKPDMGKSCIRFKNSGKIPFTLIGELVSKLTPQNWIELYETKVMDAGKRK